MANREIGSIRTVIQQVADTSGEAMAAQIAQMGTKVIAQHQEALSNERFSDAQLQLQKMDIQYQKDWEHDPLNPEALNKYRTARKGVIDSLGKDISPFFKKPWEDSTRELTKKADIQLEMWGINQTRKNTVRAVNQSIKNNLSQATMDGQNWGKSEQTDAATLLNFAQSRERLAGYAGKHLGPNESSDLLESYGDDYLKSVISGVSETNPIKALKLMDDERIANGFKDKQQYLKMKDAVEDTNITRQVNETASTMATTLIQETLGINLSSVTGKKNSRRGRPKGSTNKAKKVEEQIITPLATVSSNGKHVEKISAPKF